MALKTSQKHTQKSIIINYSWLLENPKIFFKVQDWWLGGPLIKKFLKIQPYKTGSHFEIIFKQSVNNFLLNSEMRLWSCFLKSRKTNQSIKIKKPGLFKKIYDYESKGSQKNFGSKKKKTMIVSLLL